MVKLSVLTPETIELILNSPDSQSPRKLKMWSGDQYDYPLTTEQLNRRMFELDKREVGQTFFYQIEEDSRVIGMFTLKLIKNFHASIGEILIFSEHNRNKGFGTMAIQKLKILIRNDYRIKTLFLKVNKDNQQAINCYKKAGFTLIEKDIPNSLSAKDMHNQFYMICNI